MLVDRRINTEPTHFGCVGLFKKAVVFTLLSMVNTEVTARRNDLVRLGTHYGGWTVPVSILSQNSICYCAGAGEDISFDILLIKTCGCNVHCFDPTPKAIRHVQGVLQEMTRGCPVYINNASQRYPALGKEVEKLHFHEWGLWNENTTLKFYVPQDPQHASHSVLNLQKTEKYIEADCKTISTVMHLLGHEKIDLLKLDIEGAEYAVLDSLAQDNLFEKIRCICLEFDELAGVNKLCNSSVSASRQKAQSYIQLLKDHGYTCVYQNGLTDMTFLRE